MLLMSAGILIPIAILFGITVALSAMITGVAVKNIEHLRQTD